MIRFVLLASMTLVACQDRSAKTDKAAPTPTAPVAAAGSAAVVPDDPTGIPGSKNLAGLADLIPMLQEEAKARPAVKVTPETLYDALTAAGLEVKQRKQVLAKTVNAKFCALGKIDSTAGVIGVVACEFATPELAEQSRVAQDKSSNISNVARGVNGATLVTVTNVASNADQQKRIFEVLTSL